VAFKIVQISDIHCGGERFDFRLLEGFIKKINRYKPDFVVVAGDLTGGGYKDQFIAAKKYIDSIKCSRKMIIAGNHDCRNVGYEHFEEIFGPRFGEVEFKAEEFNDLAQGIRVMAVDSNRPGSDDGEIGRDKYKYIDSFF